MKEWVWRWGPALILMALIFTASGTPGRQLPQFGDLDVAAKKGGHGLGYALLGIAYLRGLAYRKAPSGRELVIAVALACLYAATDEFHQRFIPDRSPAFQDVLIDTIGAATGVALWPGIRLRLAKFIPKISLRSQHQ
jgi:VanZ family protein